MASKFRRGAAAFTKDGRRYAVEAVEDGMVYCTSTSGAEAEFPETALMTEAEWAGRSDGRRDIVYTRLKQTRAFAAPSAKLDRAACEQMLAKAERLSPGLLDFTAFTVASRGLIENGDESFLPQLSIAKCREIFDRAKPELRAGMLAGLLGAPAEALVGAGRLGDNLMRAIIDKGLAASVDSYENFRDRRRR